MTISRMRLLALLAWMTLPSAFSVAGVNLKNGNFHITYTDVEVPDRVLLKIQRTYNSVSTETGLFGFGWGSEFETRLVDQNDGLITIHENGSGATTSFKPESGSLNIESAIERLVTSLLQKGVFANANEETAYRAALRGNKELRGMFLRIHDTSSEVTSTPNKWLSTGGNQELIRTAVGYARVAGDKRDTFDLQGRLVRVDYLKKRYFLRLHYDTRNRVRRIETSTGKSLEFSYGQGRQVQSIRSGRMSARYVYQGADLIESRDTEGNVYRFEYDVKHNLTSISYADGTKMRVDYGSKTQFTERVTKRDGSSTEYEYRSDPQTPDTHYWTIERIKDLQGKTVENRYEYWIGVDPTTGIQHTARILEEVNGVRTDTNYNSKALPVRIERNKAWTTFEYSQDGLLLRKESSDGEVVALKYDTILRKITEVKNSKGTTRFEYDDKGQLLLAKQEGDDEIRLSYDSLGLITEMIQRDVHVAFEYNGLGKLVVIEVKGVGKIEVVYDRFGEIEKRNSPEGASIALKVTQAIQKLLSVVKPAGVNLSL